MAEAPPRDPLRNTSNLPQGSISLVVKTSAFDVDALGYNVLWNFIKARFIASEVPALLWLLLIGYPLRERG